MTLDPLHIAALAIVGGVVLVFVAVILAQLTTRKPSDNGIVSAYDLYKRGH